MFINGTCLKVLYHIGCVEISKIGGGDFKHCFSHNTILIDYVEEVHISQKRGLRLEDHSLP